MLIAHDRVRRRAGRGQAVLEPRERRRCTGIAVAQPVQQLDGEGRRRLYAVPLPQNCGDRLCLTPIDPEQSIGQPVGLLANRPPARDQVRCATQVLDQHDPQGDGDGPELADRQWLHALVGGHEPGQQLRVESTVGVGDERPGESEHSRISGQRALRELGQLPIVAGRQVVPDLADLGLDDVVVVDQPLRGRRDRVPLGDRPRDGAMGLEQRAAVVVQARGQLPHGDRPGRHALCGGQALGVLLESLGAEDLGANHLGGFAGGAAVRATDAAQDGPHQCAGQAGAAGPDRPPEAAPPVGAPPSFSHACTCAALGAPDMPASPVTLVPNTTSQKELVTP